jgi:PAS domain-containing protein
MKTKKQVMMSLVWLALGAALVCLGCRSMEIGLKEKFGIPKRDQMVKEVTKARDAQNEAKEQFSSALEQFTAVLNVDGGDLEKKYKTLNAEYEESKSKAEAVSGRIERVKEVSVALFKEWEKELDQYSSDQLRRTSEQRLEQTRQRYDKLMSAMERARDKIGPVLSAFRDQVLFLKHNLNARAIASLQGELGAIESEIAVLVRDMEASIAEANSFIEQITGETEQD